MIPTLSSHSTVEDISSACSEWGAFYFPFVVSTPCNVGQVFEYTHPSPKISGGFKRGYLGYGMESGSTLIEAKEGFSFGMSVKDPLNKLQGENVWPIGFPPESQASLLGLFSDLCNISLEILDMLSLSLGKDEHFLRNYCSRGDSISICRLFNYLSIDEALQKFPGCPNYAGSSEHTDWGFITVIIVQDGQSGLELKKNNQWIPVKGKAGHVIVNLGDYLSGLTRNRYHSPVHRVVLSDQKRLSTVFFYYPDYESKIPFLVDDNAEWNSSPRPQISESSFGDLLYEKWNAVSRHGY
jgi:isopenicillin N synthase-like dioxygenase